jgi:hypothetical protein
MKEREFSRSNNNVVGVFRSKEEAERCISALVNSGFDNSQIGVVLKGKEDTERFARETGVKESHGAEGATSGAGAGAVLGGAGGILAGLGLIAIPGIGPLLAAGPIATGLAGAIGGGLTGGIVGGLVGLGIPEKEAQGYAEDIESGNVLVSVDCGTMCDRAMSVMNSYAAYNVHEYTGRQDEYTRSPEREEFGERREEPHREGGMYTQREEDWTHRPSSDFDEEKPEDRTEPYV